MRKLWQLIALSIPLLLMACSTPTAVKQLSRAQLSYFDAALEAVQLQSEALLLVAEKIKAQAEQRIEQRVQASSARLKTLAVTTLPTLDEAQRRAATKRLFEDAEGINRVATASRARLANDLQALKAKTQELKAYIVKMKEVQLALDAYLQSAQAGEQVMQGVLKQPTVESLLAQVTSLIPKVTSITNEVQNLVGSSDVKVETTGLESPTPQPQSRKVATLPQPPKPPLPQPPEHAILSEEQRKAVQRRLCVEDDGIFGNSTRRAIREYQEADGTLTRSVPPGELDQEQARKVLQLPECPPQFRTYYEVRVLSQPGAVKKLQETLNRARENRIIAFLTPLGTTDALDDQTRDALKAVQNRCGIAPADGLYTAETANAVKSIQEFTSQPDALTQKLQDFWKPPPGTTINRANEEKLKIAMKHVGVDPDKARCSVLIPTFLSAGEFAEQRQHVAKELGL
jgi:peptidoglycan hydrolase-like protein with peptidoglycan-binding domain